MADEIWFLGMHENSGADGNDDWRYLDGTSMTYSNWSPGEPNYSFEDCVVMYNNDEGSWNNGDCSYDYEHAKQDILCSISLKVHRH